LNAPETPYIMLHETPILVLIHSRIYIAPPQGRGVNLYITLEGQLLRNWGECKCQRHEAAIAEGKKPLTTRGSGGAS